MSDLHEVQFLRAAIARREAAPSRAVASHSPGRLVATALVIAAVACVAIAARSLPWGRSALTFRTEGGEVGENGYLRAGPKARARLYFSDGTQISLDAGARSRIVGIDDHGARIALDEGAAQVQVVARAGASWTFEAGPFSVDLEGGAFLLAWAGGESHFDLRLDQGSATVSGPLLYDARALRAGERMTIGLDEQTIAIRQRETPEPSLLEADISVFRAFIADRAIGAGTEEAESSGEDRVARDRTRGARSDDPVSFHRTAPLPRPEPAPR